jgi:hypothetical protein
MELADGDSARQLVVAGTTRAVAGRVQLVIVLEPVIASLNALLGTITVDANTGVRATM